MLKRFLSPSLLNWALLAITAIILFMSVPTLASFEQYWLIGLAYLFVVAWVLYFTVLLPEVEITPAHVVGIVALLANPPEAARTMLWAVAVGGFIGGLALAVRSEDWGLRRLNTRTTRSAFLITVRLTLSFYVGMQVYAAMNGPLPLAFPLLNHMTAYVMLGLANSVTYILIFALELYIQKRDMGLILRDRVLIGLVLALVILPLPFGLWSASLIQLVSSGIWFFVIGTCAVALGLNVLSRFWHQLTSQRAEMRSLQAVSGLLQSEANLDELIEHLYVEVSRVLDTDNFVLALYKTDNQTLHFPLVMHQGNKVGEAEVGMEELMLLERMLQTQQPLRISYKLAGRDAASFDYKTHLLLESWLGVPLIAGGRLLGAMAVMSHDPNRHFKANDQHLLSIIATDASIAVANAQNYQQQAARAAQLAKLNDILSQLSGTLSTERVTNVILQSAGSISDAKAAALYWFGETNPPTLRLNDVIGLSEVYKEEPPELLLRDLHGDPIVVENALQDVRTVRYHEMMEREGKTAWVELPMAVGEVGIGALVLYYDQPRPISADTLEILRTFAHQAAQSIHNARQYSTTDKQLERRADQMYALAAMGRQLTANTNVKQICTHVLRRALQLTETSSGFVVLDDKGDLLLMEQVGYPASVGLTSALISQSITSLALASGQLQRYDDLHALPARRPPILPTTRAQLTVPIVRGSTTLGALTLESDRPAAYSESDSYFLTQIASQTTLALDSARLFQQIADSVDRQQAILNSITESLILVERSGVVAMANPPVRLLGLEPMQLINYDMNDLLDRADLRLAEKLGFSSDQRLRWLVKELRTPGTWKGIDAASFSVQNESGSLYMRREVIPVGEIEAPTGMLMAFYDETEQHDLESARRDLSNMIVHDLRSPLTAVTTGLTLLREAITNTNPAYPIVQRTTEVGQRAIRKLLTRVDSLLDISRMESGQLQIEQRPTILRRLAETVLVDLSPLADDLTVQVQIDIPDEYPLLNVDPEKVERVLQNLMDNALKFIPSEGRLTVKAYSPGAANAPVNFVRVDVQDTGPGIPPEYKQNLFDRFMQIKGRQSKRRGTGLGLTFCKLAVESHGGRIWIEDNPGGGSIFAFTLPIVIKAFIDDV